MRAADGPRAARSPDAAPRPRSQQCPTRRRSFARPETTKTYKTPARRVSVRDISVCSDFVALLSDNDKGPLPELALPRLFVGVECMRPPRFSTMLAPHDAQQDHYRWRLTRSDCGRRRSCRARRNGDRTPRRSARSRGSACTAEAVGRRTARRMHRRRWLLISLQQQGAHVRSPADMRPATC